MPATTTDLEQKFLAKLNAQPDGNYHWTKAQLKKLAEFEATDPFNTDDINWEYSDISKYSKDKETKASEDLLQLINNYMRGTKNLIDCETELNALSKYYENNVSYSIPVFHEIFCNRLDLYLQTLSDTEKQQKLVDIIHFYFITRTYEKLITPHYIVSFNHEDMYVFINRHLVDKDDLYQRLIFVKEKFANNDDIQMLFKCFFPHQENFPVSVFSDYHYSAERLYQNEIMSYFNQHEFFKNILTARIYNNKIEYVLLKLKDKQYNALDIIGCMLHQWRSSRLCDKELTALYSILVNYHHVDSLEILTFSTYYKKPLKNLKAWIRNYPLFTLDFLINCLVHKALPSREEKLFDSCIENIQQVIAEYLEANKAVIQPLIKKLQTDDNQQALTVLAEILQQPLDAEYIQQAYQQAITPQQKPKKTTQKRTQKTTEKTKDSPKAKDSTKENTVNSAIPPLLLNDDWLKQAKKRDFELKYIDDIHSLPALVVESTQQPLPIYAYKRLLKMLMVHASKPLPFLLTEVLPSFTQISQTALADSLWDIFVNGKSNIPIKDKKWLILASGVLYHPDLDEKLWEIMKQKKKQRLDPYYVHLATHSLTLQAISRYQTGETKSVAIINALKMLFKLSTQGKSADKKRASKELTLYAKALNIDESHISDHAIPTLGLNAQGQRVFDFGERSFTMKLDAELKPYFIDNQKGKTLKSLPKANKKDDPIKAELAHEAFRQVKKSLKSFDITIKQLEQSIDSPYCMPIEHFIQCYIHNPLMLRTTQTLAWGLFDKDKQFVEPFMVVETGEMLDVDDDDIQYSTDNKVALLHPALMNKEQFNAMLDNFKDNEIVQPFEQLSRQVYHLTEKEKQDRTIYRFNELDCGYLYYRNWEVIVDDDKKHILGFKRTVEGSKWHFYFVTPVQDYESAYTQQAIQPIALDPSMDDGDISEFIAYLEKIRVT